MTRGLLIQGGRLLDPGRKLSREGSLLLRDDRIAWIGGPVDFPEGANFDVLCAEGLVVCPGFIDLHCHLREPGFEEKETILTGTRAAARGGFTTVCCMPNTKPPLDTVEAIRGVQARVARDGAVRVLPVACVSKGRGGKEIADLRALAQAGLSAAPPELWQAGVAGFSDDGDPVRSEAVMRQALVLGKELGLPVMDHCEDVNGGPPESEVRMVARDLRLAKETGGWVHIQHVSVAEAVELIRKAKAGGVRVTAEVTPHHLTLTSEAVAKYGTLAKVNPALRTEGDRQALIRGLKDGTIDCIATDHAPHTAADKARDYAEAAAGISGFETAFGSLMTLVHGGQLTLAELVGFLTVAPAGLLGGRAGKVGSLAVAGAADVAIVDPDREWTVDTAAFASRGRNTPLQGWKLKGRVLGTISRGKLVHRDASLRLLENVTPPTSGKKDC